MVKHQSEAERLQDPAWKRWGPYVSDRQWGTVREDYSENGDAWNYSPHDLARSKAYRWGEEGIGGISDDHQLCCFSLALWNGKDPILKEVYFGLANKEGNHGEDVKELYYYLDNTPSHAYMRMLYKYPQAAFPYSWLREENLRRTREEREFELMDTGLFEEDAYFDVFIEYAKAGPDDVLARITVHNRGNSDAPLHVLPQVWFRNTWAWGYDAYKPGLRMAGPGHIGVEHRDLAVRSLYFDASPSEGWGAPAALFCENETNPHRLAGNDTPALYYKDGINEHITKGAGSVNPELEGTKAGVHFFGVLRAGKSKTFRLRLGGGDLPDPFVDFDATFRERISEADAFYAGLQQGINSEDARLVQRQALAGLLWSKQFYYYNVRQWLSGDPAKPAPPRARMDGRNHDWKHLHNADIISMPDKWEYPWYANWDLAFQSLSLALVDEAFAKQQLELLTKDWYIHPGGKMPAYEWAFNDANPPVYSWAAWEIYAIGKAAGRPDTNFLETVFHKLLINFTWWVNRKDTRGHNVFEGGFLGLDNIGVFDRSTVLEDGILEQADATSWMALFSLIMLRISIELSRTNRRYLDLAGKFFSHFVYIAGAIEFMGEGIGSLWDSEDRFFYDQLRRTDFSTVRLKVRSVVGLIPLFAVEILDQAALEREPELAAHLKTLLETRPELRQLLARWQPEGRADRHLLSLLRDKRLRSVLARMLDETEFLSPFGIRSLSKQHEQEPYTFATPEGSFSIRYLPGESDSDLYGGNSNWRGPLWMPINYMLVRSLLSFYDYYGDSFRVRCPGRSGPYMDLKQVAAELAGRLCRLFLRDPVSGRRPVFGAREKCQTDPHFRDYVLFYEYFHGETGEGLGASHQTGWTALVANLMQWNPGKS